MTKTTSAECYRRCGGISPRREYLSRKQCSCERIDAFLSSDDTCVATTPPPPPAAQSAEPHSQRTRACLFREFCRFRYCLPYFFFSLHRRVCLVTCCLRMPCNTFLVLFGRGRESRRQRAQRRPSLDTWYSTSCDARSVQTGRRQLYTHAPACFDTPEF